MAVPPPAERGITRRDFVKGALGLAGLVTAGYFLPSVFAQSRPDGALPTPTPPVWPEFPGGTIPPTLEQVREIIQAGRLVDFSHPDFVKLKEALPSSYTLEHLLELERRLQRDYDCPANQLAALLSGHMIRLYGDFWNPARPGYNPNPGFIDQLVDLPINTFQGIDIMDTYGICMNDLDPNYQEMDLLNGIPTSDQYKQAEHFKTQGPIMLYYRWPELPPFSLETDLPNLKAYQVAGFLYVFGLNIYERIVNVGYYNNTIPPPLPNEPQYSSFSHLFLSFGYDDNWSWTDPDSGITYQGALKLSNSWGSGWGENGNAWLPYAYLSNERVNQGWIHAADFEPPVLPTTCPIEDVPFRPPFCCELVDANGNRKIMVDDIMEIAKDFGARPGDPNWDEGRFDFDNDGIVGVTDIQFAAALWRQSCS